MANYKEGPIGVMVHAHVNEPDRGNEKFKPRVPEFKVDLRCSLSDPAVVSLKEELDERAEQAMEAFKESEAYANMKPKDRRELSIYVPYEIEEDDDGNPTGNIIFAYRQNQTLKLRDKSTKEVSIGIYDAEGNEMDKQVRPGSEGRVMASIRDIPMPGLKKVGVRLDFSMVQIAKLASGGAGGGSKFGSIAGGYKDDGTKEPRRSQREDNSPADDDGNEADY